jgi:hypothetical protein
VPRIPSRAGCRPYGPCSDLARRSHERWRRPPRRPRLPVGRVARQAVPYGHPARPAPARSAAHQRYARRSEARASRSRGPEIYFLVSPLEHLPSARTRTSVALLRFDESKSPRRPTTTPRHDMGRRKESSMRRKIIVPVPAARCVRSAAPAQARSHSGARGSDNRAIMQLMQTNPRSAAPNIPALSTAQNCIHRTVGAIAIANRNRRTRECAPLDCAGRATALAWGRAADGRRRFSSPRHVHPAEAELRRKRGVQSCA